VFTPAPVIPNPRAFGGVRDLVVQISNFYF